MLGVLRDWFNEGVSFVVDIGTFIMRSIYNGSIVWVLALGLAVFIFFRFFRKNL
jgi:hypothetical protein